MRLSKSRYVWSSLVLFLIVCSLNESDAVVAVADGVCSMAATGIALLDVWAGVSSFSDGFKAQVHVPVLENGWIENSTTAAALLAAAYQGANWCLDFYEYGWTHWEFQHDLVVAGGPSCCPFSISGKRLRQHDPRSTQGMDTVALAVHFGAKMVIIENVSPFLEEDSTHHLVSEMDDYLQQHGFALVASWVLTDSALGGASGRKRVYLVWEAVEMASMLPEWPPTPPEREPSLLRSMLDPVEEVTVLAVGGQSEYIEFVSDAGSTVDPWQAERIGSLWLRGPADRWMLGEGLKLVGHKDHSSQATPHV